MTDWWDEPMREVFGGRRVVVAGAVAAAWPTHVETLRSAGVDEILVVATEGRGAGPIADVPTVIVEPPPGSSMMAGIHFGNATLADPPPEVVDALDRFDPDGSAIVVGSFLNITPEFAGRPFLAVRRPEWVALEDKVVVDAFWDRAGVDRLPSVVAPIDDAPGRTPSIDRGAGTVWAADARDGFHGGASATRWVADDASRERAIADLAPLCDTVRIMPFVDGVPCSIHGIVLPDGVAVLRPVEMVTLRRGHDLVYAGCATYWDPPSATREQMRSVARRVGERLATEVGFRGTFTVDGVAAPDGFWPTELNPRFGAGIMTIARANGMPMVLINDLIVGGHDIGRSATEVEGELVRLADDVRGGGTWIARTGAAPDQIDDLAVAFGDDAWRVAHDEPPSGTVTGGNGFVRCIYDAARTPVGPSTARRAVAFWRFADQHLDTGVGPLTSASP